MDTQALLPVTKTFKKRASIKQSNELTEAAYYLPLQAKRVLWLCLMQAYFNDSQDDDSDVLLNRPGFPGECFICELRLPDHRFRWKHNKLFLLLPEEYGPAFPAIVDCYTSPPT